jgi:drug/metabolite transporter (DMT)-like permease
MCSPPEFAAPGHTSLLSAVSPRERLTPCRLGVMIFGFLGALIILRPGLESFQAAAVLPLAAALAFAVALTQTKALTSAESSFAILPWRSAIQLPLALLGDNP